jgi:hypothetical protein
MEQVHEGTNEPRARFWCWQRHIVREERYLKHDTGGNRCDTLRELVCQSHLGCGGDI